MAELDPGITAAIANSNFKASAELPGMMSNVLGNSILQLSTLNIANAIQTASDSRNASTAAMNSLTKRIAELDSVEAGSTAPIIGHTQHYAASSGAGIDSAQLAHSMVQLGQGQQQLQVQLAQLITLLSTQKGS